jgi:predicted Zn-dependent protease
MPKLGRWILLGVLAMVGLALGLSAAWANPAPDAVPLGQRLPPPQVHPLPPGWLTETVPSPEEAAAGDYFAALEPSPVGPLLWSRWPVTVYVEPMDAATAALPEGAFARRQVQDWEAAIVGAIAAWGDYLPLRQVDDRDRADIVIGRSRLSLQRASPQRDRPTPANALDLRARTGTTRYEFDLRPTGGDRPPILTHRFLVAIPPSGVTAQLQGTARHELGHALGLWGHSDDPGDVLYRTQVAQPPPISPRDRNTLRRLYVQPTRLGWPLRDPPPVPPTPADASESGDRP